MSRPLPENLLDLLREVVSQRCPELEPRIERDLSALLPSERVHLREALLDEISETGLNELDEPNERGLRLEDVIDRIGY